MQEIRADQRVKRTHSLLLKTLTEMLRERTFDEIRVTDICQRAGIHRSTFYDHFEDKYHLLTFGIQEIIDILVDGMPCSTRPLPFRHAIFRIFEYFQNNWSEYSPIILEHRNAEARAIFQEEFTRALIEQIKDHPAYPYSYDRVVVLCQMFVGGLLSVVSWWLAQGENVSLEEVTDHYTDLYIPHAPLTSDLDAS